MVASRLLARISRSCGAIRLASAAALPPGTAGSLLGGSPWAAAAESGASCTSIKGLYLLNRPWSYSTTAFQRFGFSSSASPQHNDKEGNQSADQDNTTKTGSTEASDATNNSSRPKEAQEAGSQDSKSQSNKRRRSTKRIAFSDSDSEPELSKDDMVKLLIEKEELLKSKDEEINGMKDKVLRSYAEMENVIDRTKRESENSKKYAIQSFSKSLLDVADNLGRASSVVKESFSKIDSSKDSAGAVPLLKTLLEGVEMTEKQLAEVFRKFGVEKFDPLNEKFDPNRHHALFQIPDASKPPGSVAAVLKVGYMLYDRVLRPAEVGVTEGSNAEAENKNPSE